MTDQQPLLARPGTRVTSFRRDGLTFHATVAGTPADEPIVLLHGFPGPPARGRR
jgi:pimeloyl-ACP methyl ester carboxylesterase